MTSTPTCPGPRCCAGRPSATRAVRSPAARIADQDLRLLYRHTDPARAAAAFYRWLEFYADSRVPELHRLARTLDSWRDELLARFDVGAVSNGPTKAVNLLIKKVKRGGRGFRNVTNCGCDSCCIAEPHGTLPEPRREAASAVGPRFDPERAHNHR